MKAENSDYGHSTGKKKKKDDLEEYSRQEEGKIYLSHIFRDSTQD